uniref:Uncharacterized protein n=1 Tax=Ciona intestinalis TaxID=7719 RepID=H2XUP3_CIOIN
MAWPSYVGWLISFVSVLVLYDHNGALACYALEIHLAQASEYILWEKVTEYRCC